VIAVDASAILAILFGEPEADRFDTILADADGSLISAVNFWEVLVRAEGLGGESSRRDAEEYMAKLQVGVAPMDAEHTRIAADAFRRFGKRTAANLNLGDCFAYALAQEQGDGLLYKGDDFPKTDVKGVDV
jgi:ribonuclease VapC